MSELSDINRRNMDEFIAGLSDRPGELSKSEKMRRLADAGYEKADIARYLGVRYQFVYNVLSSTRTANDSRGKAASSEAKSSDAAQGGGKTEPEVGKFQRWVWTKVGRGGRLELPQSFLGALGIEEGDAVQLGLEGEAVRIVSRAVVLRELQDQIRRQIPEGVSLADELIAERRAEAAKETEPVTNG